jgi:four helix bundle protein
MEKTNFENLVIYQLAEKLADEIWKSVSDWNTLARDTIGKQIIRAADGIGANIAEGSGRGTAIDNRRFLRMARGSLYETRHWLRRAYRRKLIGSAETVVFAPLIGDLALKLNAYIRSVTITIKTQKRGNNDDL